MKTLVISETRVSRGELPSRIALRYDETPGAVLSWATHLEIFTEPGQSFHHSYFVQGHYFETAKEALRDFKARSRNHKFGRRLFKWKVRQEAKK